MDYNTTVQYFRRAIFRGEWCSRSGFGRHSTKRISDQPIEERVLGRCGCIVRGREDASYSRRSCPSDIQVLPNLSARSVGMLALPYIGRQMWFGVRCVFVLEESPEFPLKLLATLDIHEDDPSVD